MIESLSGDAACDCVFSMTDIRRRFSGDSAIAAVASNCATIRETAVEEAAARAGSESMLYTARRPFGNRSLGRGASRRDTSMKLVRWDQ